MEKHRLAIPEAPRRARRSGFSPKVGASSLLGSDPLLCPVPMLQGLSYVHQEHEPAKLVHKKLNTRRYGHPSSGVPGLSGRGYADFHADANFAITEFSEVRAQGHA